MKKLSLDEVKQVQLSILKNVDAFCRSNNINYTLAGGTLIGAVRHKGYIPWDDDIDIYMLRKDYERFVREFTSKHLKVYTYKNSSDYNMPFAKVSDERTVVDEYQLNTINIGINIDVFPVDNIPDNELCAKFFIWQIRICRVISDCKRCLIRKDRNFIKNIVLLAIKVLVFPFSYKLLNNVMDKTAQKYANKNAKYVGNVIYGWGYRERCLNVGWDKYIEKEFEGSNFCVVSSYDSYLTNVFGDYMTLPPIEKQVTHHVYVAYKK